MANSTNSDSCPTEGGTSLASAAGTEKTPTNSVSHSVDNDAALDLSPPATFAWSNLLQCCIPKKDLGQTIDVLDIEETETKETETASVVENEEDYSKTRDYDLPDVDDGGKDERHRDDPQNIFASLLHLVYTLLFLNFLHPDKRSKAIKNE